MRFADFCDSISSPALKCVAGHWHDLRCGDEIPAWRNVRPAALKGQLGIIWSYKYDPQTGFTGRLAGDSIVQILDRNFNGMTLSQALPPEHFPWAYDLCRRVVTLPAAHHAAGRVLKHLGRYGLGERIMLPLSSDGVTCDGILGATEYYYDQMAEDAVHENWFALQ